MYGQGFNANGIVEFGGYLIVPNSSTGQLFAIDPSTGASAELLPAGSVTFADGIELRVAPSTSSGTSSVSSTCIGIRGSELRLLRTIQGAGTDVPTTGAIVAGRLWVVNARFNTPPTADTPYWIDPAADALRP